MEVLPHFWINYFNQNLNLQPSGGTITLTGTTTCLITLTIASTAFIGYNNSNPYIQLGNVNGNNYGVASTPSNFSSSASTGDTVLRCINNLIFLFKY